MSWQATAWAEKQRTGSSARKVLLLILANYADEHGVCWPSQQTLKAGTELSEDTIQRQMKQLVRLGLVSVTRRPKKAGRWSGLLYNLNLKKDRLETASAAKPQNAAWTEVGSKCQEVSAPSLTEGPTDRSSVSIELSMPHSPCDRAATNTKTVPQSLRHNLPIEPPIEPSAKPRKVSTADRLRAFDEKQQGIEIVHNRIASRLGGEKGWLIMMSLSEASLARLTRLEEAGRLDDSTLQSACLEARRANP